MTKVKDLHRRWNKEQAYMAAYDTLEDEFQLARALIEARTRVGLTQTQLARRMKTSQSYAARIEGGKVRPSTDTLERFAHATGTRLRIPGAVSPGSRAATSHRRTSSPSDRHSRHAPCRVSRAARGSVGSASVRRRL